MVYVFIVSKKTLLLLFFNTFTLGALKVSYNTVNRRTEVEVKHNFLTTKEMTGRVLFFNETSATSKQMGIQLSAGMSLFW